jgi:hypothetical protein
MEASIERRDAGQERAPDFFLVGHPKSGTTALYTMLRDHPQVYMPPNKEPWFFSTEIRSSPASRPPGTGWTPHTLEEYLSMFAPAEPDQRVGEASALYLWSRSAASAIADVAPDAKIIAVLREPADFLRSLHLQFVQVYLETEKDFGKALSLEQLRREKQVGFDSFWPQATLYSEHVRYVDQLRRYHAAFPKDRVLVLIYDDYRRDNDAAVRAVQRFLDVDDTVPINVVDANPSVSVRSPRLHGLVHSVASGQSAASRIVKRGARTLTQGRVSHGSAIAIRDRLLFSSPPPADEELMSELRRRFSPEVHALSEYLDRDLVTLWGYDELD